MGHQHLICLCCGQIAEFTSPLVEQLAASVGTAQAFEVTGARVDLIGYCAACRAERAGHLPEGGAR